MTTWLLAVVWPIAAARRADRIGRLTAWCMFVPAAVLGAATAACVAASIELGPVRGVVSMADGVAGVLDDLLGPEWPLAWATALLVVLAGLASLAVAAWALSPLGSRDEPWREAYRRMLTRLLVTSPWVIGASLAVGAVAAVSWAAAGVVVQSDWNRSMLAGMAAWSAAVTLAWAVLSAIAIVGRGRQARSRWPARCEGCGYSLMSMTAEQPCPECGRLVRESIDDAVRPGIAGVGRGAGGLGSAARAVLLAIGVPWRFGRELRVSSGDGRLWVGPLALTAIVAAATPACGAAIVGLVDLLANETNFSLNAEAVVWFAMVCLVAAAYATSTMAGVVLLAAALVGTGVSWAAGRNLLPAAAQSACYASPVLIVGPLLMWLSWCVAVSVAVTMESAGVAGTTWAVLGTMLLVWNVAAPSAVAVYFAVAVGLATWNARFANR